VRLEVIAPCKHPSFTFANIRQKSHPTKKSQKKIQKKEKNIPEWSVPIGMKKKITYLCRRKVE